MCDCSHFLGPCYFERLVTRRKWDMAIRTLQFTLNGWPLTVWQLYGCRMQKHVYLLFVWELVLFLPPFYSYSYPIGVRQTRFNEGMLRGLQPFCFLMYTFQPSRRSPQILITIFQQYTFSFFCRFLSPFFVWFEITIMWSYSLHR